MKKFFGGTVAALALFVAGCGSDEGDATGNAAAGGAGSGPLAQIPAPANGDWTQVVTETEAGGMLMGNPNAPVKLIEFASMTCGHCATFAEEGEPQLVDTYVKSGQVSFELRNFVRDPADLAAALIARCNGPAAFFKLTDQLFAAQEEWLGQLQNMTPADQQALQSMAPTQAPAFIADKAGLGQFARVRGIPAAKAQQCLTDSARIEKLVNMTSNAASEFNIQGTPSFAINGRTVENTSDWKTLEPRLRAAIPQ